MPSDYQDNQEARPGQVQDRQPGFESGMHPEPVVIRDDYRGSGRLEGKVALITGGDSGIGRSVAVHYAREGAAVAIAYLDEHEDAQETRRMVENEGVRCKLFPGDAADSAYCDATVSAIKNDLGGLDILVNNAAEQHKTTSLAEITDEQIQRTFATNIFPYFYFARAALPLLRDGGVIINTTSVVAYRGNPMLLDYSATKGAIVAFTRSLAQALVKEGIRVNGVAPGPIWTPLIPASFDAEMVEKFGSETPLGRAGQPAEVGPSYVFLASEDASFMVGQVLHLNGGSFASS